MEKLPDNWQSFIMMNTYLNNILLYLKLISQNTFPVPKLSNFELGQYQMGDNLKITGAVSMDVSVE